MMNSSESWFNCLSENDVQHIWNETKEGVATALDYIEIADGLFLEEDLEPRGYHIRPATAEWHSLLIRNIKDSTKRFLATFEAVYAVHNEKSEEEKQDLRQSIIRRDQTIVNGVQLPPDFKHEFFVPGWNLYVYPPNAEPENV
uniref:Ring_hydroxyl_A domain-containing protein n=1 Tax=Caenorhabditis tropicalis TaxID=1561998 RepID=A0A1I7TN38_9PELO